MATNVNERVLFMDNKMLRQLPIVAALLMASLAHAGFPVITTIPAQTVLEDSATLAVELNITDPDNEPLTIGTSISDTDLATLQIIGTWTQVGQDMDGEAAEDYSGSVSLSADATTVAIGAFGNDANGSYSGHVRIYTNNGGTWSQVGQDIDGKAANDERSGWSVSLSADGATVAIGAFGNDSGHVRIYTNNGGTWAQLGQDINGESTDDWSGWSVSLSADGATVAIGATNNGGNGEYSGHVRIYAYDGIASWTQLGQDIDGEAAGDRSGHSVSLSADGATVAIGATFNGGNGASSGHVRIYNVIDFLLITPKENVNGTATVTITATDTADNETSSTFTLNVDIDTDGDGVGNNADTDDDNDGVLDTTDAFATNVAASVDTDLDGLPDSFNENCDASCIAASGLTLDLDDDNDGISDTDEIDMGTDPTDESDCITCGPKSWWRFKLM